MSFLVRRIKSDVEINLELHSFENQHVSSLVHDKYIYIPIGINGDNCIYDVYQLCNGCLIKTKYKDRLDRNYYIKLDGNTFYASNPNTGNISKIYTVDEYIKSCSFTCDIGGSYIIFNNNNVILVYLRDDIFEIRKYTFDSKYMIMSVFETQDNIYFTHYNIYDKISFAYLNKLSNIVTDLSIQHNDIYDYILRRNNKYYFGAYDNKITVINKKNQIKTYNFTYSVNYLYCNNNYVIIRDQNMPWSNIYNMKLQLVHQINKSITHLSDKIIVFNNTEIYEIIPITHKIKKLFVNTEYKHILRMFI